MLLLVCVLLVIGSPYALMYALSSGCCCWCRATVCGSLSLPYQLQAFELYTMLIQLK